MSQSADERLVVMLEARVSEFEKRMAKAEGTGTRSYNRLRHGSRGATQQMEADMIRSSARINQALASTSTKLGSFAKTFAMGFAGGAITAAFAGLTSGLNQTVRGIAQIGDEAKRSGLSLQTFQEWKFVAEQNRIGIDALVDGFKELSLRADEFIVTGSGSAADAFKRLGFSAADLKKKLKDPSALMLEIIGRLEGLDKAAQIRIADELFGGTGGEQFVQLLDQGEAGIRKAIATAHQFGGVMSQEMIDKADELDRKWQAVTSAIGTGFQKAAVHTADFITWLAGLQNSLDDLLGDEGRARTILGNEVYEDLKKNQQAVDENAESIAGLDQAIQDLQWAAHEMAVGLAEAAQEAAVLGNTDLEAKLMALANEMNTLQDTFNQGKISAEQLATGLIDVRDRANDTFSSLSEADQVSMAWAIEEVGRLEGALMAAAGMARSLAGWLAHVAGVDTSNVTTGTPLQGGADANMPPTGNTGMTTSPRPGARPVSWSADMDGDGIPDALQKDDRGGGGKKGGGGKSKDEFSAAMEATREQIAVLEAETLAFLSATDARGDYAGATEYAKKKAELLIAAQKQGIVVTPELTAQIEEQARAYATAGLEAEQAADRLRQIEEASERGRDALGGFFGSIIDGSKSAKQAVADLLAEIAKAQLNKGLMGLFSGSGGLMAGLGSLLGFAGGGYTGDGATMEPKGVVHGGEFVFSKKAVQRLGLPLLSAMHRGLPGFSSGGLVPGCEGRGEIIIERK